MCVYNAVNGTPGCASADLLQKRLREEWGFQGYVVSDCGAVNDIHRNHKYTPTLGGAAVAAVKAGTDLTCGTEYRTLVDEVKAGRITEAEIDRSLERLFVARFRLGMFDPPERVPYSKIPIAENDSSAHRQLARDAERAAIVLLKNEGGVLPLSASVRRIAVDRPLGGRSRCAAGQLQRHLVQAGDSAGGDRAAVLGGAGALRARCDLHGQHARARSPRPS